MKNAMRGCQWGGIGVELGGLRRTVDSIDGVEALFRLHKLPMNPKLLNYRYFHQSMLDASESIERAIGKALAASGIPRDKVDMLILTSADLVFLAEDRQFMPTLLERTGLVNALPLATTAQECAGLLYALDMGWQFVASGRMSNVLVVSYDKASSEDRRVQPFGIVSDAAVAALVSAEQALGLSVRRFAVRSNLDGMGGKDDFACRKALVTGATGDLLDPEGVTLKDIGKVFTTNFFSPLTNFNASCLGLRAPQLYVEQAPELGHCLGADPLLNLAMYLRDHPDGREGKLHMLQAYAPGFLAAMLIEQVGEVAWTDKVEAETDAMMVQSW